MAKKPFIPAQVVANPPAGEELVDWQISMSNVLTRAAHDLKLAEKRLIVLSLAGTDSVPLKALALGRNAGWKMRVTAEAYAQAYALDASTAYEQLQAAAQSLFERRINYTIKGPRGKLYPHNFRWVSGAVYLPGSVELNFTPEIAPHLLGLRKQFTSYKLRHAAGLDTVYSWRLFELLKSWQDTGLYAPTIEEFWVVMAAPESLQKDFGNLRARLIEPAIKAINERTGMRVEWRPVSAGSRRVSGLEFRFQADPGSPRQA